MLPVLGKLVRNGLSKWRETLRVHAEMYTSFSKGIVVLLEQEEKKRFLGGWRDGAWLRVCIVVEDWSVVPSTNHR